MCRARDVAASAARQTFAVMAADEPATVADTKKKFLDMYPYPIPSIWSVAINELLVQQHFVRYNSKYQYSKLASLGFVSVYDQLTEGFPDAAAKDEIFACFVKALEEDPVQVRSDANAVAEFASSAGGVDALAAEPMFAEMKAMVEGKKFMYSKYIAIGLFRMLELAKATEPAALETLAAACGTPLAKINSDLGMYKSLLSKLSAAKELQAEFLEREKRKTAERLAKKEEAAAAPTESTPPPAADAA